MGVNNSRVMLALMNRFYPMNINMFQHRHDYTGNTDSAVDPCFLVIGFKIKVQIYLIVTTALFFTTYWPIRLLGLSVFTRPVI